VWHAEHWEPEKLLELYKRAGAKYFVALANHHDNFDNWNSKYHEWNSVRVGPRKDLVGGWARPHAKPVYVSVCRARSVFLVLVRDHAQQ